MLSLDEAIAHEREVAKDKRAAADWKWRHGRLNADDCISCAEEHEQLAEWLEDYKQIKMLVPIEQALKSEYSKGYSKAENDYHAQSEKDRQSSCDYGYEVGYNKAIDDFVNACKEDVICKTFGLREIDVIKIAEQLKAGGKNDKK